MLSAVSVATATNGPGCWPSSRRCFRCWPCYGRHRRHHCAVFVGVAKTSHTCRHECRTPTPAKRWPWRQMHLRLECRGSSGCSAPWPARSWRPRCGVWGSSRWRFTRLSDAAEHNNRALPVAGVFVRFFISAGLSACRGWLEMKRIEPVQPWTAAIGAADEKRETGFRGCTQK